MKSILFTLLSILLVSCTRFNARITTEDDKKHTSDALHIYRNPQRYFITNTSATKRLKFTLKETLKTDQDSLISEGYVYPELGPGDRAGLNWVVVGGGDLGELFRKYEVTGEEELTSSQP